MNTHYLSILPIYISINIEPVVLSRICWIFLAALLSSIGEVVVKELAQMKTLPKGADEREWRLIYECPKLKCPRFFKEIRKNNNICFYQLLSSLPSAGLNDGCRL